MPPPEAALALLPEDNRREQEPILMRTILGLNSPISVGILRPRLFALPALLAASLCWTQMLPAQTPAHKTVQRHKQAVAAPSLPPALPAVAPAPTQPVQDSITIKDPAEFRAYKAASAISDPKAKAVALESFLHAYPQSLVKSAVLDELIDTYQRLNDADGALDAAGRQLQVDPVNLKAIYISVYIKKGRCSKTFNQKIGRSTDPQICDDAADLAREGLSVPKPATSSDDDWKRLIGGTYPVFHSAIALDQILSKRDVKAGIAEYRTELMIYPPEQTKSGPGLWDTLQLAEAYSKPEAEDLEQAVWFYARAWNFVPASLKTPIETKMKFYCKKHYGDLNGLRAIKTQTKTALFLPGTILSTFATSPSGPAGPLWPANEKPLEAAVTWDSHGLYINAANSSLQQILKDVATVTGATVEGLDADERIFGSYGPGKAHEVLTQLLHGTSYNVIMIGDQGEGTPREILLSSRHAAGGTTVAANPTPNGDDETDADDQPQQQPQPPMRPGFGPGGQRTPQQMQQEMQQRQQQIQQRQQQGQPPLPPQPQPPNNPQ